MESIYEHFASGIKPDPVLTYSQWADRHFYLPRESTSEYGKFRCSRTPFIIDILNALSPSDRCSTVTLVKPTQQAGTTCGLVFICGMIDMYPAPAMLMFPTDTMAKNFSKKKLNPALLATPKLKGKIADIGARRTDKANTILQKDFLGGSVLLTGATSAASYRSESVKYLVLDDFDGFDMNIEGEGDPKTLADRRTGTFAGRKIFINSTTTTKGFSNIEIAFAESSQAYRYVPCPHCGEFQYLQWGSKEADYGIKFTRDDDGIVVDAWYLCIKCKKRIDEYMKTNMDANGRYVEKVPARSSSHKGFRYNALISPLGWVNSWPYIAQEYLSAYADFKQGAPQKLITWTNTLMAEPFEETGEQPDWTVLMARCEKYSPLSIPASGKILLTSGTDVQWDRLAVSIWAWTIGEEAYLVYHTEIYGDPMHNDVWEQHDMLINRDFKDRKGTNHRITSGGVDSGDGSTSQAVYNYCRSRQPRIFALKGVDSANRPIVSLPSKQDVSWQGLKIPGGVELWPIGSSAAKQSLYSKLRVSTPGPGMLHFYHGLTEEYFMQLTAEKLLTRFSRGYPVREWHNIRGNKRNEALDCLVYAYAAALRVGLAFLSENQKPKTSVTRPVAKPNPFTSGRNPWLR